MSVKRGDIYYIERSQKTLASGSEMYAGRPAIIVSNDHNNANSNVVEIVYLTTKDKNELPTHVTIRSSKKMSVALCEQVTSISVDKLSDFVGRCTDSEMQLIDIALAISLDIEDNSFKAV